MGVLRIGVEVDSEVYPELHAQLSAMRRSASRAERVRQLAASGLVWETVRLDEASARRRTKPPPRDVPVLQDVVAGAPPLPRP